MTGQPRAVMLRPLGLGDFLTGIPAYCAVARAFPNYRRILAAPAALAPLVELVAAIDELVDTQPLVPLAAVLEHADVAIDLHGRGPASQRVLLAARPRRLIAFANPEIAASARGAAWRADEHEVMRWCRMLAHAGIAADPDDLDLRVPACAVPPHVRGALLIHASAASESRRWPIERWAAVARAQIGRGRTVILTGDSNDVGRVNAIADRAGIPASHRFAGRTDLRDLAAFVAAAGTVACGDTGVGHLATAYRIPSVVLFGPIAPAQWGPPGGRPFHRALWAGRHGDPHAAQIDPGLLALSVDAVNAALATLDQYSPLTI